MRLPKEGVETVVDLYSKGSRIFLKVSRILHPLRELIGSTHEDCEAFQKSRIPVELSYAFCQTDEPLVQEILRLTPFDLASNLKAEVVRTPIISSSLPTRMSAWPKASAIHTDLESCELWTRLITYSYGVEQLPPRRFYRRDLLVSP